MRSRKFQDVKRSSANDERGEAARAVLYSRHQEDEDIESDISQEAAATDRPQSDSQDLTHQIVGLLGQIRDRLGHIEQERDELWDALNDQTKILNTIEDRSMSTEKTYLALDQRLNRTELKEAALIARQDQLEQQKAAAKDDKAFGELRKDILKRLEETDRQSSQMLERVDEALAVQNRMSRRLDKVVQEKQRLNRRLDRMEETMALTREALSAKAMVLLTDKSIVAENVPNPRIPLFDEVIGDEEEGLEQSAAGLKNTDKKDNLEKAAQAAAARTQAQQTSRRSYSGLMQGVGGIAFIGLAIFVGWAISQSVTPPPAGTEVARFEPQEILALPSETPTQGQVDETTSPESYISPSMASLSNDLAQDMQALELAEPALTQRFDETPEEVAVLMNSIEPGMTAETPAVPSAPVEEVTSAPAPELDIVEETTQQAAEQATITNVSATVPPETVNAGLPKLSDRYDFGSDPALPEAVRAIEAQALAGNAEAQHDLAAVYTAGHAGVRQDYTRAAYWFERAAEQGIANARYNLGVLYHQGMGIETNLDAALFWYNRAAQIGHPEAQYNLGIAHIEGIGVAYDPKLASQFFEAAAASGISEAAYNLGLIHENGLLGVPSPEEALLWYKSAADSGNREAQAALEQLAGSLEINLNDIDQVIENLRTPPIPLTTAPALMPEVSSEQALLSDIQAQLMSFGLYPGPADGATSPVFSDAVRSYQVRHGLPVTGEASEDLLLHMLASSGRDGSRPEIGSGGNN